MMSAKSASTNDRKQDVNASGGGLINNEQADPSLQQGQVAGATLNGVPIVNSANLSLEQKRQMSMFVMADNGSAPQSSTGSNAGKKKNDFILVEGGAMSIKKTADKTTSQQLSNLDSSILQGKILDAVLETAINTQLPGTARAIVSNDVYAEVGKKVLIPRGSRIFGSYSATVNQGQSRISIAWSRIVRPDGVSVTVSAQASDQFGRAGLEGDVDNRFGDSIANALLVTLTSLGTGLLAQQLGGSNTSQSQIVNPNGTFTTTGITPLNYAAQSAIQQTNNLVQQMTQGLTNVQPVISLPQGTKIKVIVAQDITMPAFKKVQLN
jgi:type IV secretion system protein VirB10